MREDQHYREFVTGLRSKTGWWFRKYGRLLREDERLSAVDRDRHRLQVQREQLTRLIRNETALRKLLASWDLEEEVFRAFVSWIRAGRRTTARPFFREKQAAFVSSTSSPSGERPPLNDVLIDDSLFPWLTAFATNAVFANFVAHLFGLEFSDRFEDLERKVLSKRATRELRAAIQSIRHVRDELVETNLRLVVERASVFARRCSFSSHMTLMDLVGLGVEGMLAGVDKLVLSTLDEAGAPVVWQGEGEPTDFVDLVRNTDVVKTVEPGSVFRSVVIGRMFGNFIESNSQTLLRFSPGDRQVLYRAHKLEFRAMGTQDACECEGELEGCPKCGGTGTEVRHGSEIDFEALSAEMAKPRPVPYPKPGGPQTAPGMDVEPDRLRHLMSASGYVSTVRDDGTDRMDDVENAVEDPEEQYSAVELRIKLAQAVAKLPLVQQKLLKMRGVNL